MKKIIVILLLWAPGLILESVALEPAGARIQGMGGAGAALPQDAVTVYYNPAGIYFQSRVAMDWTARFEGFDWPASWGLSYLKYIRSTRRGAGFGIYRIKDTLSPEKGDAVAALLATVYHTPIGIPVGLSFKYINEKWQQDDRKSYFSTDLGLILPYKGWVLGLNYQSLTDPGSHLFPSHLLCGLSNRVGKALTLALQLGYDDWADIEDWEKAELRTGLELQPADTFALQGGWARTDDYEYWTGGLGIFSRGSRARFYVAYHWHYKGNVEDRLFISYNYSL